MMVDYTGEKLGNYRLMKLLGRGGFADVYLGEHIYLQTVAAIKILRMQLTDEVLEKFLVEARTVARLSHPNIVSVLEFGIEDATPFLVMSYAPYGSLRQRHPRGSQLPAVAIVFYVEQVAAALQYAHDRKVIHCDIKPENMLLGQNEALMLSDFGIAISLQNIQSAATQGLPNTAGVVGTTTYMAPEQLHGKPSFASDQYALGVVIYEWFCGTPPFRGSAMEVATRHLQSTPPPMREKVAALAPTIEQVVLRALAKDPRERFASTRDFASALKSACLAAPTLFRSPKIISLPSLVHAPADTSLLLSSADFPADGHVSHTVAVPSIDTPVVHTSSVLPDRLTRQLQDVKHVVSRRSVVVGLVGLTAAGLVTALGTEKLWYRLLQPHAGARPQKPKLEPTATPNIAATAEAAINTAATRPAVTSAGMNSLDCFVRGGDNALWHRRYDGNWHNWETLGGITADPAAAYWGSGRLDMFVKGTAGDLQHKWNDGNWHDWETLGGTLTSEPAVTSSSPEQLDILARGIDNGIWYNHYDGSLHDWGALGGVSLSAPAVTSSSPGRVDVFVRGGDNGLWYRWFAGEWGDWTPLGGSFVSDPAVTSWGSGRLDVFVIGSDTTLQHKWFDGSTWNDWETLGGTLTSSPAAVSWGSSRIDVFARSTNNMVVHRWFDSGWNDWQVFI
jgi:serine/threonine protein kinase